MGSIIWVAGHWFEVVQTVGITGSLLFVGYTTTKDERARQIGNSIAINEQYARIWHQLYDRPKLARVLSKFVDLKLEPTSVEEELFVTMLIMHLSTVYRAMTYGELVKYEGLQQDVKEFFSLPIPRTIWKKVRKLQDESFSQFIEAAIK